MNKKILLKVLISICITFMLFFITNKVQANSIQEIDMNINIQNNGDANVTETWLVNATEGTEIYHPYYSLGNSRIKNMSVNFNSKKFTTLSSWNVSGTFSSKAYKCGINNISNGVELCFGISEYGKNNKYVVNYTITNFVSQLTDSQMAYWTLIPYDFSNTINYVEVTISANEPFADTIDVWGYGKKGAPCYVKNGKIHFVAEKLGKSEYVTILAKFPNGTFNTANELDYNFQHYLDMAEKGAVKYNKEKAKRIGQLFNVIFPMIIYIGFPLLISRIVRRNKYKDYDFEFGVAGKYIPKDVPYFRDIPLNGDLYEAYYICDVYDISKGNESNIIGAIFLKWLKEKKIELDPTEVGLILKKDSYNVILNYTGDFEKYIESRLYSILTSASKDGILENKEFERWAQTHYTEVERWFKDAKKEGRNSLISKGLIIESKKQSFLGERRKFVATPELKEEAKRLAGLKRYLKDYTLMHERTAPEVQLFESYLMFAQIFGIADKVSKDFKELYPDLIENTEFTSYDYILYTNMYSHSMATSVSRAAAAAEAASSYSGGGGGFSSGGGGGGSFGGGGGGRRFPLKLKTKMSYI